MRIWKFRKDAEEKKKREVKRKKEKEMENEAKDKFIASP